MSHHAQRSIYTRDVSRDSLAGVHVPTMTVELDNPSGIDITPQQAQAEGGAIIFGRITTYPTDAIWHDGTTLSLSSLALTIQSLDGYYQDKATTAPKSPKYSKLQEPFSGIKFGSPTPLAGKAKEVTIWPFLIRVPASILATIPQATYSIRISGQLTQRKGTMPVSVLAPTEMQIHSEPTVVNINVRHRASSVYPLSPPMSAYSPSSSSSSGY